MNTSSAINPGDPLLLGTRRLHALWLAPPAPPRARVLILTPWFEEKRTAHRALVTCARAAAAAGAAVLLPDLTGTGNSPGHLGEITLDTWLEDLRDAIAVLSARATGPLVLVGVRAGALLATHALAEGVAADRLVLWQPVVAGKSYLNQLRTRRKIQDEMTGETPEVGPYEIEGEPLAPALYAGIERLRLPAAKPPADVCLLQCSFTDKLLTEYARLVAGWGEDVVAVHSVVAEPFWHAHTPRAYDEVAAALAAAIGEPA